MSEVVSYKAVVEYICNPDKFDFCKSISEKPDNVDSDKIPLYWGLLGIALNVASNLIAGSGWSFNWGIRSIGWSLMKYSTATAWGPVVLLWLIRFFIKDNDIVNWLYVLSSNFTMLGPIILDWLSALLIIVGWGVDSFNTVDVEVVLKWFAWIILAFLSSFY